MVVASFDLYYLLVDYTFGGSAFFAIVGLLGVYYLLCILGDLSFVTGIYLTGAYAMSLLIGFYGGIFAVPVLFGGILYLFQSYIPWIGGTR